MSRPITLFTGQWADLPFEEMCRLASEWGYDGLEIACWGDHLDPWQAADLVSAIAEGQDPWPSFAEGLTVQRVLAAVESSAGSGRWQQV